MKIIRLKLVLILWIFNHLWEIVCNTILYMIFQYGDFLILVYLIYPIEKWNRIEIIWILIKRNSQWGKIMIPRIHPLYPIPSTLTNFPINEFHISKLDWRQISPCQYILSTYILYPFVKPHWNSVQRIFLIFQSFGLVHSSNEHNHK